MSTGTQRGKTKKTDKAVVGRSLAKKRSVKVVDVKLASDKKKKRKSASKSSTKKTPVKKASTKKAANKKNSAKKNAASKRTSVSKKKAITKKKTASSTKKPVRNTKAKQAKPSKETKSKAKKVETKKKSTVSKKVAATKSKKAKVPAKAKKTEAAAPKKTVAVVEKAKEEKVVEGINPDLRSPSMKLLRPFRTAAKENRKLLRARATSRRRSSSFIAKPPKKGKKYLLDLRVHSPGSQGYFSPGGVEPGPAIIRLARVKGLDAIGLTDYYNASFIDEVKETAWKAGVRVIPGVDLCCEVAGCCEIFVTVLFPEYATAAHIFHVLNELEVPESAYGRPDYLLRKPFADVVKIVETHGGVLIPSRVDKTPYRQLAIPTLVEEFGLHAFDLVHPENPEFFQKHWPDGEFTFFAFSNAHALGQIGNRGNKVKLAEPGFQGIKDRVQRRE